MWKDCRLAVIMQNFGLSLTWSQTPVECTVFAGRTRHFIVFVVQQLIWLSNYKANIKIIFVSLYQTIYSCM